jgi:hypothetical protein
MGRPRKKAAEKFFFGEEGAEGAEKVELKVNEEFAKRFEVCAAPCRRPPPAAAAAVPLTAPPLCPCPRSTTRSARSCTG